MNKTYRIKKLVEQLNYYRDLYYNESRPEISDFEYDYLFDELSALERETGFVMSTSPTQTVGYEVKSELQKVIHNHPMLSLAKTKDWNEFIRYFKDKDVIGMVKMDGLTCSLRYVNGTLVSAETRGNGETGEDIIHNIKTVKTVPRQIPYKGELIIDGEIICTYEDFKPFSDEYKNPRNFASGSIRLLDSKECAKRPLTFVAWNVIKGFDETNSFLKKLNYIEALGFVVVPWTSSFDFDAKEFLIDDAKELGYPIDGLVGRFDDIKYGESLGTTSHHSNAAYAYKFYDEVYETTLRDIEWTLGKTSTLTPTAVFDSVEIDGTEVSRASISNISVMYDTLGIPYVGQTVYVTKRNMIIPKIERADNKYNCEIFDDEGFPEKKFINPPQVCPICGEPTTINCNYDVKTLICINPNCSGKLLGKLAFFVSKKAMDIDGMSEATLEFLINKGWVKKYVDLYHLDQHVDCWTKCEGFGKKSVEKILAAIEKSRNVDLTHFITALSIPNIGSSAAKTIANEFHGDYNTFIQAYRDCFDWTWLDDFGVVMAASLEKYLEENFDMIQDLAAEMNFIIPEKQKVTDNPFMGKVIVVTGRLNNFTRDSINDKIASLGAKTAGSVSKNTDFLLTNEASRSSKYNKAIDLDVTIITENEFLRMIGE